MIPAEQVSQSATRDPKDRSQYLSDGRPSSALGFADKVWMYNSPL